MIGNPLPWRDRAQCLDIDPYLFETPNQTKSEAQAAAKTLCGGCPVVTECLTEALRFPTSEQHGIVGGLTADQRVARILRYRKDVRARA